VRSLAVDMSEEVVDYVIEISTSSNLSLKQSRGLLSSLSRDLKLKVSEKNLETLQAGNVMKITKKAEDPFASVEVLKLSQDVAERQTSLVHLTLEGRFTRPDTDCKFDVRLSGPLSQCRSLIVEDLVSMIKSEL